MSMGERESSVMEGSAATAGDSANRGKPKAPPIITAKRISPNAGIPTADRLSLDWRPRGHGEAMAPAPPALASRVGAAMRSHAQRNALYARGLCR